MSVNQVDKQTGDTSRIAGGTLYADAPIGAILAFGGATAPAGWLLCQGQAVSRTTYAALFAAIGTAYGAGDGSTTFNLPDPREAALVGAGTNVLNAGSIAAHNAVSLGAFQDDQFQTHAHHVYINNDPNYPVLSNKNLKADGEDYWNVNPSGTYPIVASTEYEGNRAGTTTHGKQLGVNYIIKAQQVALPADFATELDKKQNITDDTLETDSKTVPGAINEINTALIDIKGGGFVPDLDYTNSHKLNANDVYSPSKDGFLIGIPQGTTSALLTINDLFTCKIGNAPDETPYLYIPVKVGDTIKVGACGAWVNNRVLWFVPVK